MLQRINVFHLIRKKRRASAFITSIKYSTGSCIQWNKVKKINNKGHKYWKGKSKSIFIQKWHDCLPKKSWKFYKTPLAPMNNSAMSLDKSLIYKNQLHF